MRCSETHEGGDGCDPAFRCWTAPARCLRRQDHYAARLAYGWIAAALEPVPLVVDLRPLMAP